MSDKVDQTVSPYGDHQWPDNLFDEMYDMCVISFMIYRFAHIVELARKHEDFVGITVDSESGQVSKSDIPDEDCALKRSYTPTEVKKLVRDNIAILKKYGPFEDNIKTEMFHRSLDELEARAQASSIERPIAMEEYDDIYQKSEIVYGIFKDSTNKRITVVFRGTDVLSGFGDWKVNFSALKTKGRIPDNLKDKLGGKDLYMYKGFYNALFDKTKEENDEAGTTKYDQLKADLKYVLAKHPDHKIYVTGHSMGGSLSTVASFYLSCDPDIPKPVSNVSFAAPKAGDETFLKAVQHQEKAAQLRIVRSVNENDTVAAFPSAIFGYRHVGVEVRTYKGNCITGKSSNPDIDYPKLNNGCLGKLDWKNSFIASLNLGYDHGDYLFRIIEAKEYLEEKSLNALYTDEDFVGYTISRGESGDDSFMDHAKT